LAEKTAFNFHSRENCIANRWQKTLGKKNHWQCKTYCKKTVGEKVWQYPPLAKKPLAKNHWQKIVGDMSCHHRHVQPHFTEVVYLVKSLYILQPEGCTFGSSNTHHPQGVVKYTTYLPNIQPFS